MTFGNGNNPIPSYDWVSMSYGENFYNKNTKEYCIIGNSTREDTIGQLPPKPPTSLNRQSLHSIRNKAIDLIYILWEDKFGHIIADPSKYYKLEDLVTQEYFYLKEWHMPTKGVTAKYLFAIEEEILTDLLQVVVSMMDADKENVETSESDSAEEDPIEIETDTEEQQTSDSSAAKSKKGEKPEKGSYVVIGAQDLDPMMSDLQKYMMSIGKDYECAYRLGSYNVPNLRFGKKISKIQKLHSKILDLLSKSNVKLTNVDFIAIRKAVYGEVELIDEITCFMLSQTFEDLTKGTKNLHKKDPFSDPLIVNIFFNAPEIVRNSKSADPMPYDLFITEYFTSVPKVDSIDPLSAANTLLGGFSTNGTGAAACAANFAGTFLETVPGNEVSGQLTKFSDCLEDKYSDKTYDFSGKQELESILKDPILLDRRTKDALNTKVGDTDPLINQLKENIESSKNLTEIYEKVLNPLGAEGVAKLLAEGALLQLKCMTLDKAIKQICISALQSTISTQIYELYQNTVITRKKSKLIITDEFTTMWVEIFGPDYPLPTVEEIQPLSYTPPPDFDIKKRKKEAFVIGLPAVRLNNPLIANTRETFISVVEQDLVSPYEMAEELFTNTSFADLSEDSMLMTNILGIKDSAQLKVKVRKPKIKPISMPYIAPIETVDFGDLAKVAIDFAEQALIRAATEVAKALMIKVLDAVFGYCDDPLLAENIVGSSKDAAMNIMRNELCSPNATDDEVSDTISSLLNSFSVWDVSSPDSVPSSSDVREMMEASSEAMSPQEMIDVLNGKAGETTYNNLRNAFDSMDNSKIKNALSSESSIENMFASLGTLINRNALQDIKDIDRLLNIPPNSSICADPFQVVAADEATVQALIARGLSDEQIGAQLEAASHRALERLDDTVKSLLNSGNIAKMPQMDNLNTNDDGSIVPMSSDPTKPEDGLYPMEDASTKNFNSFMFNDIFDTLDSYVMTDMMDGNQRNIFNKGFLDMILSSKKGRGYTKISQEFFTENSDGEVEFDYSYIRSKTPEYVSDLYQVTSSTSTNADGEETTTTETISSYDSISSTKTQISGTYTGTESETTVTYDIGGNIKIDSESVKLSGFNNSEEILVYRGENPEIKDYVAQISPQSTLPSDVFSNWCKTSLENILPSTTETEAGKEEFMQALDLYINDKIYSNIVENVAKKYSEMAIENEDSWLFGRGEVKSKIVDLDPAEYGKAAYTILSCKQNFEGWLNIYQEAIPVSDGQNDPLPLFNFVDIKKECQQFYDTFPVDDRMQTTALVFKKYKEPPFGRINTRVNNAVMAAMMKATARLHIYDSLIKGTAFFKVYKMSEENYGEVFSSYICDTILKEVLEESLQLTSAKIRPMGVKGYYYIFLEQLVQCYSNMIAFGGIIQSAEGTKALRELTEKVQTWSGMPPRIMKLKQMIDESMPQIKVILSVIVKEQMEKIGNNTKRVYLPNHENLMTDLVQRWLFGGTLGADPFDGPLSIPVSQTESDQYPTNNLDFPFILEKYVRLEDKDGNEFIQSPEEVDPQSLPLYEESSIGVRITLYLPDTALTDMALSSTALDYLSQVSSSNFDIARSGVITPNNQSGSKRILIPLATKERAANLQDIKDESSYRNLAEEMLETPEFKTLFEKCIPMKDILSFITIYTIENFVESLGIEKRDKIFSEFSFWDGDTFQTSKKYIKDMTQQSYYARDSEYINQINSDGAKQYLDVAKAMGVGAVEAGLNGLISKLPKWKRKKRRPVPPDTDPCEEIDRGDT